MPFPKLVYTSTTFPFTPTTLPFTRGPVNFSVAWKSRVHDNLATSGLRERVVEAHDLLIAFTMPALRVADDLAAWTAFMSWALDGKQFDFYPDGSVGTYYHCVSDDDAFDLTRTAPGQYSATFKFRIVPDSQAPGGPDDVLGAFYGLEWML